MAIDISLAFTRALVAARWDTIDKLAEGWAVRVAGGQQRIGNARDRATLFRWLKHGIPNRADEIFGLGATLDVDPMVMVDIEGANFKASLERERWHFLANLPAYGKYSALWPLIRPSAHWPNVAICEDYYGRDWTVFDFSHDPGTVCNVYAQVNLQTLRTEAEEHAHRVYYIAYRRTGADNALWYPYGLIRKRGRTAIHLAVREGSEGPHEEFHIRGTGGIDVETYLGPGPVDFRIACLHPFVGAVTLPSRAVQSLRFPG